MKKKNHIKVRFSTILLFIPAILLCTAPRAYGQFFNLNYEEPGEYNVTVDEINFARGEKDLEENGVLDWLDVGFGTIVNLYADVSQYVLVHPGSVLNIYSGSVGYVIVSDSKPYAVVTVYGTDFAINGQSVSHGQVVIKGIGELTGTYGGNGGSISLKFLSDVPINLKPPPTEEIQIDIKPGSDLNNINLKSKGVVPVAVLSTDDFDASTIDTDTDTVKFAGVSPVRWTMEDVDDDGDEDMLFHFRTKDLELDENSTKATLTATLIGMTPSAMTSGTTAGEVVQGTDEVCIKPGKNKK